MNLRDQLSLFFYIVILVINAFLNGLVLIAVCSNRSLLLKRRFAILISLALADFLKIIPITIQIVAVILGPGSKGGRTSCFYASTTGFYLIIVTVVHLAVESINRLVSIVWPLRYELFTNSKFFVALFPVMWLFPCLAIVFLPYAVFQGNYDSYRALRMRMFSCTLDVISEHARTTDVGFVWYAVFVTVTFFAIPFVVMGVSYAIIFKISLKHITEIKRIEDRMSKFRQERDSISAEIASIHNHSSPSPDELVERVRSGDFSSLEQNGESRVQDVGTKNVFLERVNKERNSYLVAEGGEMADRMNNADGDEKLSKDHVRIHSIDDATLAETSTERDNSRNELRPPSESEGGDKEELRAELTIVLKYGSEECCREESKDQNLILVASNEESLSPREVQDENENTRKQEIEKNDEENVNRKGREVRAESIEFADNSLFGIDAAARNSLVTHQREIVISPVSFQEMNAGPYEFIKEFSIMAAWAETLRRKAAEEEEYSFTLGKFHNLIKEELKSRKREIKLAKTLGGLVGAFLLFYLPLIIVAWNNLATDKHPTEASFDLGRGLVAWAFLNSLLNPLIYGRRVAEMRRAVHKVVRRFKSRVRCSKRS